MKVAPAPTTTTSFVLRHVAPFVRVTPCPAVAVISSGFRPICEHRVRGRDRWLGTARCRPSRLPCFRAARCALRHRAACRGNSAGQPWPVNACDHQVGHVDELAVLRQRARSARTSACAAPGRERQRVPRMCAVLVGGCTGVRLMASRMSVAARGEQGQGSAPAGCRGRGRSRRRRTARTGRARRDDARDGQRERRREDVAVVDSGVLMAQDAALVLVEQAMPFSSSDCPRSAGCARRERSAWPSGDTYSRGIGCRACVEKLEDDAVHRGLLDLADRSRPHRTDRDLVRVPVRVRGHHEAQAREDQRYFGVLPPSSHPMPSSTAYRAPNSAAVFSPLKCWCPIARTRSFPRLAILDHPRAVTRGFPRIACSTSRRRRRRRTHHPS